MLSEIASLIAIIGAFIGVMKFIQKLMKRKVEYVEISYSDHLDPKNRYYWSKTSRVGERVHDGYKKFITMGWLGMKEYHVKDPAEDLVLLFRKKK